MSKTLGIDWRKCIGCGSCADVCSARILGSYSNDGSRIRILRSELHAIFLPILCLQCEEHPCVASCPVGAIQFAEEGCPRVSVLEAVCVGCGSCAEVCPHRGVVIFRGKAMMCDLCSGNPACVQMCYSGALQWSESGAPIAHVRQHAEQVAGFGRVADE